MENTRVKTQLPMQGFPSDGNPWRIDWIGGISYSFDDEPRLRIYLSRIKKETPFDKALLNSSLFQDDSKNYQHIYFDSKIGFIQLLKLGSVWVNGFRQFDYKGVTEQFKITLKSTELLSLTKLGTLNKSEVLASGDEQKWEPILGNFQHRVVDEEAKGGAWVVLIRDHPIYKKIVIPSSIIFQRCYVTSPKAASKIIFGQIDKLIDIDDSGFVDGETNIFRVHIHKDYQNIEAPMLINLVTDPAGKVNLNHLRRNLVVSQSNNQKIINLQVNFPFSNLMDMEVVGRTILYIDPKNPKLKEKGFFVTEIQTLRTDFQFDTFVPVRKNSSEKGLSQAEELIDSYGGDIAPDPLLSDEVPALSMTNNTVSSYLEPIQVIETIGVFPNKMEEVRSVKELQKYKNKGFTILSGAIEDGGGISTGVSRAIQKGEHELKVELVAPAKLERFFNLLKLINEDFHLDFLSFAICNSIQSNNGIVNFFDKKIPRLDSWHYAENKIQTRGFVLARCHYAGVWHYLIDVEAKGASASSIAYITQGFGGEITDKELALLMTRFAQEHGWSVLRKWHYAKSLKAKFFDHVRTGSLDGLANRIMKEIKKID